MDGYDFIPTANVTVTALGWYDHNGDGLLHDHAVGIYITSTQLLAAPSVVITTGSTLDVLTNFRYQSTTPFLLQAGIKYTLAGYGGGPVFDPYVQNPAGGLLFGPNIGFQNARSGRANALQFPIDTSGLIQDYFIGPNFRYTIGSPNAAAPEPGSIALLLIAGVPALGLIRRRKSHVHKSCASA